MVFFVARRAKILLGSVFIILLPEAQKFLDIERDIELPYHFELQRTVVTAYITQVDINSLFLL